MQDTIDYDKNHEQNLLRCYIQRCRRLGFTPIGRKARDVACRRHLKDGTIPPAMPFRPAPPKPQRGTPKPDLGLARARRAKLLRAAKLRRIRELRQAAKEFRGK